MRQGMKTHRKTILAWVLAIAMIFANVEPVSAAVVERVEETQEAVSLGEVSGECVSVGDVSAEPVLTWDVTNGDVSEGSVSAGDVSDGVPTFSVSENDISTGNVSISMPENNTATEVTVIASGRELDILWSITSDGVLSLSGSNPSINTMYSYWEWHAYSEYITSAVVTVENAVSTYSWFDGCRNLKTVDLSNFDTGSVENMSRMFANCISLETLDLSNFNTESVLDMSFMFYNCSGFKTLDLSNFDTSNVVNMSYMFSECNRLETVNISNFDTGNVRYMNSMFEDCNRLKALDLSNYDTENVRTMEKMFLDCSSLETLKLSNFKTGNVMSMAWMFCGCGKLKTLNLASFETGNVTSMNYMFYYSGLETLDLSGFDINTYWSAESMFENCDNLKQIRCFVNLQKQVQLPWSTMYDDAGNSYTDYFPCGLSESIWLYKNNPQLENCLYVTEIVPQIYTGKAIKPQIQVYNGDTLLKEKVDYTLSYKNNTKVNDASDVKTAPTIVVKGKGNYTKQDTVTFQILAKNITDEDIIAKELVAVGKNKIQLPVPVLTYNGKKLVNKKDFVVSYPDLMDETIVDAYKAPGTYCIMVTGIGNFTGTLLLAFTITDGTLMSKVKVAKISGQEYTGSKIEPQITVSHGKKLLIKGTDYMVDYANNVEIGKATVTITGMGDYAGSKTATFQIIGKSIAKAKVEGIEAKTYNGKAQTQNVTVTLKEQEKPLVLGQDYTVSYAKNVNAGTATMIITGVNAYSGTIKKSFKINAYDLSKDEDRLLSGIPEKLAASYEKGGCKPGMELAFDGADMVVKKDYTISYANNTKVTDEKTKKLPTITVKGKGNFKGTIKISFVIEPKKLETVQISVPDKAYSKTKGKYISKPVLTDTSGKKLVAGTDYDKNIEYSLADGTLLDKKSVVEAGQTIKVTINGKGNYEGTITATYKITVASFQSAKIKINPQIYTGKAITLDLFDFSSVKVGKDTLVYGEDFEIVEGSYKNNVKKGTASVSIRGKGNYGGEKTVKFKIVPKEMIWFWKMFDL